MARSVTAEHLENAEAAAEREKKHEQVAREKAKAAFQAGRLTTRTVRVVRKEGDALGLEVRDRGCTAIHKVLAGSAAALAGCRAGEVIIAVNKQSVVHASHRRVLGSLKEPETGSTFTMTTATVKPRPLITGAKLTVHTLLQFQDSCTVLIPRPAGTRLGLELQNLDARGGGTLIRRVVAGGAAAAAGCRAGGRIVAINGRTKLQSYAKVLEALKYAQGPVLSLTTTLPCTSEAERNALLEYLMGI